MKNREDENEEGDDAPKDIPKEERIHRKNDLADPKDGSSANQKEEKEEASKKPSALSNNQRTPRDAPSTRIAFAPTKYRRSKTTRTKSVVSSTVSMTEELRHSKRSRPGANDRRRKPRPEMRKRNHPSCMQNDGMKRVRDSSRRANNASSTHTEGVPENKNSCGDVSHNPVLASAREYDSISPSAPCAPAIHLRSATGEKDGWSQSGNENHVVGRSGSSASNWPPSIHLRVRDTVQGKTIGDGLDSHSSRQRDRDVDRRAHHDDVSPRNLASQASPGARRVPGIRRASTNNSENHSNDELSASQSFDMVPFPAICVEEPKVDVATNVQVIPGGQSQWTQTPPRSFLAAVCIGLTTLAFCSIAIILFLVPSMNKSPVTSPQIQPSAVPSLRSTFPTPPPTANFVRRVISDREDFLEAIREYMLALNDGKESELDPIEYWNVSAVTDMSEAFSGYRYPVMGSIFNSDISRWDVSNVKSMVGLFAGAQRFNQNLSRWNTSKVTSLSTAFFYAESFNGDVSTWDTSRVQSLYATFRAARVFSQDISRWDVSKATTLRYVFTRADAFNADISHWNVRRVTSMSASFSFNSAFKDIEIGKWDVSNVVDMHRTFQGSNFNADISDWNTSRVTDMHNMFDRAYLFDQDISRWDVRMAGSMKSMFANAHAFNRPVRWETRSLHDMREMFRNAEKFNSEVFLDLSNVQDVRECFQLASAFNQSVSHWNVSGVLYMNAVFDMAVSFDQNLSSWDVQNVLMMDRMFAGAEAFNGDVTTWKTNNLMVASEMFAGAISFNQDISQWNVSRLTNATGFLANARSFDQSLCPWYGQLGSGMSWMNFASNSSCAIANTSF